MTWFVVVTFGGLATLAFGAWLVDGFRKPTDREMLDDLGSVKQLDRRVWRRGDSGK